MKTKRYRAATMRDALEKVKQELGENALVLDSKRVRAGGFLGLGGMEQIEVRVAADELPAQTADAHERQVASRRKSKTLSLNLTDDAPALPAHSYDTKGRNATFAYDAVAARANADEPTYAAAQVNSKQRSNFDLVEVATTAPRIVHQRRPAKVAASSPTPAANTAATPSATPTQPDQLSRELERLRAELREVKFSLNAFSSRSNENRERSQNVLDSFEVNDEIYDSPYYEAYLELAALGLAPEIARHGVRSVISLARDAAPLAPHDVACEALKGFLPTFLKFEDNPLAANRTPRALALVGPTGVGKTTTLAKLAARVALREHKRVELVSLDTYRIAATEQLKTYADIIGAGFHVPRSILELDTIVRRFANDACVLIDTTGRSPNDLADQMELADYLRSNEDVTKCLVLQATTQPADASVAVKKFALYGANRLAITKIDETTKPGAAIDMASASGLALSYLCAGQRVPEDLEIATPETFSARVMRPNVFALAA